MAVRRLNHAVLYVNGLAREVEFYTKTLGSRSAWRYRRGLPSSAPRARPMTTTWPVRHRNGQRARKQGRRRPEGPACTTWRWEVGTLGGNSSRPGQKLLDAGALVGERATTGSRSPSTSKDPSGIEFEVLWRVPVEDLGRRDGAGRRVAPSRWTGTARCPSGTPHQQTGGRRQFPDLSTAVDVPLVSLQRHQRHIHQ